MITKFQRVEIRLKRLDETNIDNEKGVESSVVVESGGVAVGVKENPSVKKRSAVGI